MIDHAPDSIRAALIESVPIVIGRADASGLVLEVEGSLPRENAFGQLVPGKSSLLELLAGDADEVRSSLRGGQARFDVQQANEAGVAHFEVRMIFDQRRGGGAYFLVHDVTETRQLQVALLNCTDHEQIRIGQDLHDTLGQELTGIAYRLQALREFATSAVSEEVGTLQEQVSRCLKQARDIAFKLSPHIEGGEITGAFQRLCAHVSETFDVECVFTSSLEQPINDPGVAFNLFRIAQESSVNAVRHGAPSHIGIHLVTGAENRLEIADDGIGVDRAEISDFPGMGIPMMKFRAASIGGSLHVTRRQPSGTIVRCNFENKHCQEAELPTGTNCETCS